MPYQSNVTCATCNAPLGPIVNGVASGAIFDNTNPNSPGYCGAPCLERGRGAAQVVINSWEG